MGIFDRITSALVPRRREREDEAGREERRSHALTLRDDLDRWLEGLFEDPSSRGERESRWMPATNVHETDREAVVTMELPGIERGDIELMVTPDGLVVRGEKREEMENERRGLLISEVRYGSFVRTVPLPAGVDVDDAEARFDKGVLTVRFPKRRAREDGRRIPIGSGRES